MPSCHETAGVDADVARHLAKFASEGLDIVAEQHGKLAAFGPVSG